MNQKKLFKPKINVNNFETTNDYFKVIHKVIHSIHNKSSTVKLMKCKEK